MKAKQDAIAPSIRRLGGVVQSQLQDAYNGMRVRIAASKVTELQVLPNVKAIRHIERHTPTNADSVPFLEVPSVWQDLGLTGARITIAVIDTRIDYYHANLGGSGDPADYAADDPTVIEPGTFPTAKVAGGYDFVGNDYDASSDDPALNTPEPARSLDCNGHAPTSPAPQPVQGCSPTAAPSPVRTTKQPTNSFLIGPGVAPQATLYALKVFGCDGSTDVTVDAIEWAVEHDLDVINMSLGAPFGRANDPSATAAATNAAAAGVVVVVNGQRRPQAVHHQYTRLGIGRPLRGGDGHHRGDTTSTSSPSRGDRHAELERFHRLAGDRTGGGVEDDTATADVDESLRCAASDRAVQPGDVVVTYRGCAPRVDRAILGQAAGAAWW